LPLSLVGHLRGSDANLDPVAAPLFYLVWGLALLVSLRLFLGWTASGARAWLSAGAARGRFPRGAYLVGLGLSALLLGGWLALLLLAQDLMSGFLGVGDAEFALQIGIALLTAGALFVLQHPATPLIVVGLWAFPLAAGRWGAGRPSATGSSWAWLDEGPQEADPGSTRGVLGLEDGTAAGLERASEVSLEYGAAASRENDAAARLEHETVASLQNGTAASLERGSAASHQNGAAASLGGGLDPLGALRLGLAGGLIVGGLLVVVRIGLRLALDQVIYEGNELYNLLLPGQAGVAVLTQLGVAFLAARRSAREPVLHGLAALTASGALLCAAILGAHWLLGPPLDAGAASLMIGAVMNLSALLALPVAWAAGRWR